MKTAEQLVSEAARAALEHQPIFNPTLEWGPQLHNDHAFAHRARRPGEPFFAWYECEQCMGDLNDAEVNNDR